MISMDGKEVCAVCAKRLYPFDKQPGLEIAVHKSCFKCCHCRSHLSLTSFHISPDRRLHCGRHPLQQLSKPPTQRPTNPSTIPTPHPTPVTPPPSISPANTHLKIESLPLTPRNFPLRFGFSSEEEEPQQRTPEELRQMMIEHADNLRGTPYVCKRIPGKKSIDSTPINNTPCFIECLPPSPRVAASYVVFEGFFYIFGGLSFLDQTPKVKGDPLYRYHPDENRWFLFIPSEGGRIPPHPRESHTAVVYNRKMYIYGGVVSRAVVHIFGINFSLGKRQTKQRLLLFRFW